MAVKETVGLVTIQTSLASHVHVSISEATTSKTLLWLNVDSKSAPLSADEALYLARELNRLARKIKRETEGA